MKKFVILITAGLMLVLSVPAQTGVSAAFPLIAGDTLSNADTVTKSTPVTDGYSVLSFQINVKQLTGGITGKAYLFRSADGGQNYMLIDSMTLAAKPPGSMFLSGTATHLAYFEKTAPGGDRYLVNVVNTATTTTGQVRVYYTARKYPQNTNLR